MRVILLDFDSTIIPFNSHKFDKQEKGVEGAPKFFSRIMARIFAFDAGLYVSKGYFCTKTIDKIYDCENKRITLWSEKIRKKGVTVVLLTNNTNPFLKIYTQEKKWELRQPVSIFGFPMIRFHKRLWILYYRFNGTIVAHINDDFREFYHGSKFNILVK
jgi:hypothetical protein